MTFSPWAVICNCGGKCSKNSNLHNYTQEKKKRLKLTIDVKLKPHCVLKMQLKVCHLYHYRNDYRTGTYKKNSGLTMKLKFCVSFKAALVSKKYT